ncbi:MAG: 1-acyl-sn-glycerol-3-phosphate acyltransferase [Chloroflexi bacterium]|nr:MAG: 1-acyl-sn-glycerol-3-phosphate acyltransferase [Chloroflexota bacterium]
MAAAIRQPPADLLPVQRQATPMYWLARVVLTPAMHLLFRFEVTGREHIPTGTNFVLIANHLNWLDSFTLLMVFPAEPRVHFLGDTTVLVTRKFQWWVVRQVGGFIPVDKQRRADQNLFQHVDRCLQRGGVVALYPEAQYGPREGEVLPFKKGFAHFAIDNHVPVVPVGLSGTKDIWLRKTIKVAIGRPIPSAGRTVDDLVALGHDQVAALLPPYTEPGGTRLLRRFLTTLF